MTWKSENNFGKHELIEQTMCRLEKWCAAKHGRKSQVARALALHPSQVAKWIARGGVPRLQKFCELIDFLDRQVQPEKDRGDN